MALYWLRRARAYYARDVFTRVFNNEGMCDCFHDTCPWYLANDFRSTRYFLSVLIPEFNFDLMTSLFPSDLDFSCQSPSGFWWRVSNFQSRLSAFNYLDILCESKVAKSGNLN